MPASSYARSALDVFVREAIDERVVNYFARSNKLIPFLGLSNPSMLDAIGHPGELVLMAGGASFGDETDQAHQVSNISHDFPYTLAEPAAGASVSYGGATDTASAYAEDNFGTARTRYWQYAKSIKLRGASLRHCESEAQARSVTRKSLQPQMEKAARDLQIMLWHGGTGSNGSTVDMNTAAQQAKPMWSEPLGLVYSVGTQNNIYGTVNRTTETNLNPILAAAATAFPTTVANLEMIRNFNHGYTNVAGTAVNGAALRNPNGFGCPRSITTPTILNKLKQDAEARGYQMWGMDMPERAKTGFTGRVIEFEGVLISDDPDCPAGVIYMLDPDHIVVEVPPAMNFAWNGFKNEKELQEGGVDKEFGLLELELRLTVRSPHLMGTITGVTV